MKKHKKNNREKQIDKKWKKKKIYEFPSQEKKWSNVKSKLLCMISSLTV